MIKITNGIDVNYVTKGMFKEFYSGMGYRIVNEKNDQKQVEKPVVKEKEEKVVVPNKETTTSSKK